MLYSTTLYRAARLITAEEASVMGDEPTALNLYDRAIIDLLVRSKAHVESPMW